AGGGRGHVHGQWRGFHRGAQGRAARDHCAGGEPRGAGRWRVHRGLRAAHHVSPAPRDRVRALRGARARQPGGGAAVVVDRGMTPPASLLEQGVVARVRLRARRRALWLRVLWEPETVPKTVAIAHEGVDRGLTSPAEAAEAEAHFYERDSEAQMLGGLIEAADGAADSDERWAALRRLFGLGDAESDLLALATAVSFDPGFARVCGYLHDDATVCYATPLLARALFQWGPDAHVCTGCALARWQLAVVPEHAPNPGAPNAPWVADPHIVRWLAGESAVDPVLGEAVFSIAPAETAALDCLDPTTLEGMREVFGKVRGAPVEIELVGTRGAGKRTRAAQLCAALNRSLLVVDAARLLPPDTPAAVSTKRIAHALRASRLDGAVLYWQGAEALDERARSLLDGAGELAFFGIETATRNRPPARAARQQFRMGRIRHE